MNLLGTGTPSGTTETDGPYTLGHDIVSSVSADATAIRFYKPDADVTERGLFLWTTGGTLLAQVYVTPSAAAGWYQGTIAYTLAAGTTYRIGYSTPGQYRVSTNGLISDIVNGTLKAVAGSGMWATGNGFPSNSAGSDHYCVDIEVTGGGGQPYVPFSSPYNKLIKAI
jgi:hypothetical protein